MLELRPNCELCDCDLRPEDNRARICSNECPNCGGGFVPRPIRPLLARREGVSRMDRPPQARNADIQSTRGPSCLRLRPFIKTWTRGTLKDGIPELCYGSGIQRNVKCLTYLL
jgi:hypothetical protein